MRAIDKILQFTILALGLWQSHAHAEIFKCLGVWTNKPCDALTTSKEDALKEKQHVKRSPEELRIYANKSALNNFEIKRFRVQREFGVSFDPADLRELCLESDTPTARCRSAISLADDRLEQKVAMVKAERRALIKDQEALRQGDSNTQVFIEQNTTVVVPRVRRHAGHNDYNGTVLQGELFDDVLGEDRSNLRGSDHVDRSPNDKVPRDWRGEPLGDTGKLPAAPRSSLPANEKLSNQVPAEQNVASGKIGPK